MDKFGLFNLLSALVSPSANDEHIDSAPAPDPQNQTAARGTDSDSPAAVPTRGFFRPTNDSPAPPTCSNVTTPFPVASTKIR